MTQVSTRQRPPFFLLSAISMASAQSAGKPQSQNSREKTHSKPHLSAVLAHHKPRSARLAGPRTGARQPVIDKVVKNGKPTGELFLRILFAPFKGAKKPDMKTARSTHGYPGFKGQTRWLTEAAARAAMPDFVHWVEYGINMPQRAAMQTRWTQVRERRRLGQEQAQAASCFNFDGRTSGRGWCSCSQMLATLCLFEVGAAASTQPLHARWCNRTALEPFSPRPASSYTNLVQRAKSTAAAGNGDAAWAQPMRARAAQQLSLNTRKARSRARGNMVSLSRGGVAS